MGDVIMMTPSHQSAAGSIIANIPIKLILEFSFYDRKNPEIYCTMVPILKEFLKILTFSATLWMSSRINNKHILFSCVGQLNIHKILWEFYGFFFQ